ncbi:UNVERIFIED_CONTAM: hypothetical protein Slati_3671800 [Sesamum latifolium]|uniref:RNase H type-1 domain-containing protein n=1 Tax=Sesamum latifolium TaxID=2727402 RepID=A0AAW2U521_9LAMI
MQILKGGPARKALALWRLSYIGFERARHLIAYSDSQLVVKQVEGIYEEKEENMIQYLQQIVELKISFKSFQIVQIPREENVKADCLSMLASALEDCRTRHVTVQYLPKPRSLLTDWKQPGSRLEPFDFSYKEESLIINPIHIPYFGACLNKRESMSSKKYITDVVGHMQGHGY